MVNQKSPTLCVGFRCHLAESYAYEGDFLEIESNGEKIHFDNCIVGISDRKLVYDLNSIYGVYKNHTSLRGQSMKRELASKLKIGVNGVKLTLSNSYNYQEDEDERYIFINSADPTSIPGESIDAQSVISSLNRKNKPWSDQEVDFIKENPELTYKAAGTILGRSPMAVCVKKVEMRKMGILEKSDRKIRRRKINSKSRVKAVPNEQLFAVKSSAQDEQYKIIGDNVALNAAVRNGNVAVGATVFEVEIKMKPAYIVKPGLSKV